MTALAIVLALYAGLATGFAFTSWRALTAEIARLRREAANTLLPDRTGRGEPLFDELRRSA